MTLQEIAAEVERKIQHEVMTREEVRNVITSALQRAVDECVEAVEDAELDPLAMWDCDVRIHCADFIRARFPKEGL